MECALLAPLESIWMEPDQGIWEVGEGAQHYILKNDGVGGLRQRYQERSGV